MNPEETAKLNAKKAGSVTAIISLTMVIAAFVIGFIFVKEDEMHMISGEGLLSINADSWMILSGFSAIILACISMTINRIGKYSAIALISGIMGFLIIFLTPTFTSCREKSRRISCADKLKQIGLAIRMYSQENSGQFPDKSGSSGLEMLRSGGYLDNVKMYACPSTTTELIDNRALTDEVDYVYSGGYNENTSPDTPIAYDKPNNHYKFRNVLFADGHVSSYSYDSWEKIIKATK